MKVRKFEFGSVQIKKDEASIQIPKNEFKYDSIKEIDEIVEYKKNNKYLNLTEIKEVPNKERVKLKYDIPKGYMPLCKIKKESLVVKLSIAKAILEDDVLNGEKYFTSIHPSTLFYQPMSKVKYMYRSNHLMPRDANNSNLERYKALVLSLVTGLNYEICLSNKQRVLQSNKKNKDLLKTIIEAKSKEELRKDLKKILEYEQYNFFQEKKHVKRISAFKKIAIIVLTFTILVTVVGITKSIADKEKEKTISSYEEKIENIKAEYLLEDQLSQKEYKKAAKTMEDMGKTSEEIADMLLKANLYQEALDENPEYLEKIIDTLYENDQEEKILDLELEDNSKLELEKDIVSYDYNQLKSKASFVEDEKTAFRIGKAFVDNGDIEDAKFLQSRIESEKIGEYIKLKEKQEELKGTKKKLKKAKKKKKKKKYKNEMETLEKEIEKLKENNDF